MKSFGPIFERLVDSWPKPVDDIATGLGVTRGHVYNLKKKESVDLSMLDKVCRYFKVSPIMFFDNDILKYSMGARDESQYGRNRPGDHERRPDGRSRESEGHNRRKGAFHTVPA